MLPRYAAKAYRVLYLPNDLDILRVVHKRHPEREFENDELSGGWMKKGNGLSSSIGHPAADGGLMRRRASMAAASIGVASDEPTEEHAPHEVYQMQSRQRPGMASTTSLAMGSRTDMSTGLQLTPSRGFDFSTEEGGVAIRRIQTGLSERHGGGITGPSHPPVSRPRKSTMHLFPSLRRSLHRKGSRPIIPTHDD